MDWYNCSDCDFMDLKDVNKYGECYCSKMRHYYKKSDPACHHFQKNGKYIGSDSHCYITTCVCSILKEEDTSDTMQTIRFLRDTYMKKEVDCYSILREYEVVGPIIAKRVLADPNKETVAKIVKRDYLDKCVEEIKEKKYDEAIDRYIDLTNSLINHYGIEEIYTEEDVDKEIDTFMQRKRTNN